MKIRSLSLVLLIALVFSAFNPLSAQAQSADAPTSSQGVSPAGMLNPDGTLKLSGSFNGALNLDGYNVTLDPNRGPVFGPASASDPKAAPASLAANGNWATLGYGDNVFNEQVNAIAVVGADVYVGGNFTDAANVPAADFLAKWDGANWSAVGDNGAGNGALTNNVTAMVAHGTDLYIGGGFANVSNHGTTLGAANYIVKFDTLTGIFSGLGSNGSNSGSLNSAVTSLALDGSGNVYVGGYFTNINNNGTVLNAADNVAKFDGTNWSALGSNGAGDGAFSNPAIYALAADSSGNVYVGGSFTNVNNNGTVLTAADYVAKWDGANWSALSSNGSGNGALNTVVKALAVDGSGNLYVGGGFNVVENGVNLRSYNFAKWNGTHWSAVGNNTSGYAISTMVESILVNGTDIYVGGYFTDVRDHDAFIGTADHIAKFDGSNWSALGSDGAGDGSIGNQPYNWICVKAIGVMGTKVFAGGNFHDVNNGGTVLTAADNFAQFDSATGNWSAAGSDTNGPLSFGYGYQTVYAMAKIGTDVYVGGAFEYVTNHGVNIPQASYLAKWDGVNWSAVGGTTQASSQLSAPVYTLAVHGTDLYVGGSFTVSDLNAIPLTKVIARVDTLTNTWYALGSNGAGSGSITSGIVYTIAVDTGGNVYAGGTFLNVNNNGTVLTAADYVAKWDGSNWSALGSDGAATPNGSLSSAVNALTVDASGNVYVGGNFTDVNNGGTLLTAADYIAKWDPAANGGAGAWSALGSDGGATPNGSLSYRVMALAINGTDLYAGGSFTNVKNNGTTLTAADFIAKYDTLNGNWSALGSNGANNGSLEGSVFSMAINGNDLYVGGNFIDTNNNGTLLPAADSVAKYDMVLGNWSALGSNGAGDGSLSARSSIFALVVSGTDLYVGGVFANASNNGTVLKAADYVAAFGMAPDTTSPAVTSITRADANPTNAASINFTVVFSENVKNVDASDFSPITTGITGANVSNVGGSGAVYTVTVNTGTGNGTLHLDVPVSATILDMANNPLASLPYTGGETYSVRPQTFTDVPLDYWSWNFIERLFGAGITGGCSSSPMMYCPGIYVTRDQMAVFLLRGEHGSAYTPPPATGTMFSDIPADYWAADWIEQLATEGITGGCGPSTYCPNVVVTRDQMAVFLLRGEHGGSYVPPTASGVFSDVPANYWAADWIEQLAAEGITGGCGANTYCPATPVTRDQMAVFLVRAFNLP